ncbi:CPBP family intramembrane glutamic endopeptidase [Sphingobacterium siyangense]|uniref:CPBP family intramembrane glutamic endopeptidase n=1 Tax=Sphingobacterium siyangense TaxID=459529 RepID=UPI003C75BB31
MKIIESIKKTNWLRIALFYGLLMLGTFAIRKLPNIFQMAMKDVFSFPLPWNMNHGLIILIISAFFYALSKVVSTVTLFGPNKTKSLLFPFLLFVGYGIYGFNNNYGVDEHVWALLFCLFTLLYDIMEEFTWRGYLNDSLGEIKWPIKSVITGIFWAIWHLLIFDNFSQFGGFAGFVLLCIVFSFVLTFSTIRTNSIIAPATLHALLGKTNLVTLLLFILFIILLLFWNKKFKGSTSDAELKS